MKSENKVYLLIKEEVVDSDGYYEVTKKDIVGVFANREIASDAIIIEENIFKKIAENNCRKAYDNKNVTKYIDYNGNETVTEIYWDPDREYWTRWWIEEMYLEGKEESNACAGTSDYKE